MVQIHRKVGGKLSNAAEPKMIGAPVVIYQTPYRYIDRNITPELIADSWKMPLIFSSVSNLIRLCFGGLDPKFTSIDGPEDDTKQKQIEQAAKQFKQIDKKLARIGFKKNCNTLECVRRGALEAWSWRKGIFEKTVFMGEGNLYAPRLQHLPGQSFNRAPTFTVGQINRYQSDAILKGIIFDTQEAEIHFYQNVDSIKEPVEIPADQVLYFEDIGVPPNTSMLHSIISTIEFMKQARHDFRLALQRIGTPKEVAEVDGGVLAQMKAQQIEITGGYQTLVDYCNNMMQTQSSNQAEVALPGTRFKYPNIPIALNPMDVEKFIEQIILNHFFAKGITEQLAQAVSVSATPAKALLDGIISGHQEAAGLPFVKMWQEDFLDANGYDLVIAFDYYSWAPADQKAESEKATTIFAQGGSLVNDYRAAQGLDPYTPEQLKQLFDEQNALKRGKLPGEPEQPAQPLEAKGTPLSPEELAVQERDRAQSPLEPEKKQQQAAYQKQLNYNECHDDAGQFCEGAGGGSAKGRVDKIVASGKVDNRILANDLGFTKTPTVLSNDDFEKEIANGDYIVGYRGLTSSEHADAFEEGDYFTGSEGIFGEGIYVSTELGEVGLQAANYFAKEGGAIEKIAIPKDAKIINGNALVEERSALAASLRKEANDTYTSLQARSGRGASYQALEKKYPAEFKKMDVIDEVRNKMSKDDGYAAKLLGYDAINYETSIADKQMVILNRGILKTTRIR